MTVTETELLGGDGPSAVFTLNVSVAVTLILGMGLILNFYHPRNVFTGVSMSLHTGGGGCPSPLFFPRSLDPGPLCGVPPSPIQDWGACPHPETEQQSEYLLREGRYASCGHAEGLSFDTSVATDTAAREWCNWNQCIPSKTLPPTAKFDATLTVSVNRPQVSSIYC